MIERAILTVLDGFPSLRLTVRQIYYQLVTKQVIPNTLNAYKRFDRILVRLRKRCPEVDARIEDRTRPRFPADVGYWNGQENYVEVWTEKDALSGILRQKTRVYKCALQVTRGYPSLSVVRDIAGYVPDDSRPVLLYFGDFDPSGEDIFRHISEEISERIPNVLLEKVALTEEDIERYDLPPVPAKKTDSRYEGFVSKHGDRTVELDALPPDVLLDKVSDAILRYLDVGRHADHKFDVFVRTQAHLLVEEALRPLREKLTRIAVREILTSIDVDAAKNYIEYALSEHEEPDLSLPREVRHRVATELTRLVANPIEGGS